MSRLDELYRRVTVTISEIEDMHRRMSRLEEEIAKLTLPTSPEGRIARRGAVRAAIAGRDEERAKRLVDRFLAEDGIEADLVNELKAMLNAAN